ncbi:conjugative transposon protein TraN [Sphingobacterium chungjuense]|uniref:conjugative transposon protein TraN n=1 Tax=Sphingobacterium chungjuense TaxID=2675553 RepID=UPI00140AC628|nr:conjugative transposon protein TraN [Sphingobacterium chungjuense]
MKKKHTFPILFLLCFLGFSAHSQQATDIQLETLPELSMHRGHTVHILSPEPIRYVDIASHQVSGDLPLENVLRIKLNEDTTQTEYLDYELGTVTIVGDNFLAQYRLTAPLWIDDKSIPAMLEIKPDHTRPLEISEIGLSRSQMKNLALGLLAKNVLRPLRSKRDYGIGIALNCINTIGDYIFLDVSFTNTSNLSYNVDELRLFIEDKKIAKATNVQVVEIKPLWQYQPLTEFKKRHRNVFVLKKATFPGSKVLRVTLTEKQTSGRTVNLKIKYGDILNADTF